MMGIGFPELMIILVIIMIIFGAGKLPEIGSAFGKSIKNFKGSMKEAQEEEAPETGASEVTAENQAAESQSVEGKPSETAKAAKEKEEDILDEAAKEIKENRIGTIKTKHDGLVQERDVFTDSVRRVPFGMKKSDRGVSRDVL